MTELTDASKEQLRALNAATLAELRDIFLAVCHSKYWADEMCAQAPFSDLKDLLSKGAHAWSKTNARDWKEALDGHPRIGERKQGSSRDSAWSRSEQAAAASSQDSIKKELKKRQLDYENHFGFIFLICASGLSSQEILDALNARMANDSSQELAIVAQELGKIIILRLEKLLQQ